MSGLLPLLLDYWWLPLMLVLVVFAGVTTLNGLTFPRLRHGHHEAHPAPPRVSILIPARNEAPNIAETVSRLLAQSMAGIEVILLDDESEDGTAAVALRAANGDERFRVVSGGPLPPGWLGKNWACHQLAEQATGEVLIFTDADVRWAPDALRAVLGVMQHHKADTLTVWPTQTTRTWGERLVVPLMGFVIMAYLPEFAVRLTPWPVFSAANGQCLAFRRGAYEAVGGHAAVRANVVEDIALGWRTKATGHRLVMADGDRLIGARMYRNWPEVRDGYAKNILAGHGGSPVFLAASTVFHWALFVVPWVWLALGGLLDLGTGWPFAPLAMIALGVGTRAVTAALTHQRVVDALLMPVSVVLMTVIAVRSLGSVEWKGRPVRHQPGGEAPPTGTQRKRSSSHE